MVGDAAFAADTIQHSDNNKHPRYRTESDRPCVVMFCAQRATALPGRIRQNP
jgi:hypothetical protein